MSPEFQALKRVPQNPDHHPEGDVFIHSILTFMVANAILPPPYLKDDVLRYAALLHDIGKASTTKLIKGRYITHGHDDAGEPIAKSLLLRLGQSEDFVNKVSTLVKYHMKPILFVKDSAGGSAYRRLNRNLEAVGLSMDELNIVSVADRLGRTSDKALQLDTEVNDEFRKRYTAYGCK